MVSINNNNEYALKWDNYTSNLTINLKDLLQRKELVDVTLIAADGHLFSAHRLVLSALSPYFQQIFAQMPVNQQAFVFLKDVPRETLEDLMSFIYSGKVNVKQEHLEDFFNIAKALSIKGLVDGECTKPSASNSITPTYDGVQYQSTRTVLVPDPTKSNLYEPSNCKSPINTLYQHRNNFEYEQPYEVNVNGNEYGDYFCSDIDEGNTSAMDQEYAIQDDEWKDDRTFGAKEKPTEKPFSSMAKRTKTDIDISEYNTVADIRTNTKGQPNLFIADQKFIRHNHPNGHGQQRWKCTKENSQKCRAAASTIEMNGMMMMKIVRAEHAHE